MKQLSNKKKYDLKANTYNSSGSIPASFRMLFNNLGCSIFEAWNGTVVLLPSAFLKILWLPLWRTQTNPCFLSTTIIRLAVSRGSRGMTLAGYGHFHRGKNDVPRFPNIFRIFSSIFDVQADGVFDVFQRLLVRFSLAVAPLQPWSYRKIASSIFFDNDRKMICAPYFFHICKVYSLSLFLQPRETRERVWRPTVVNNERVIRLGGML